MDARMVAAIRRMVHQRAGDGVHGFMAVTTDKRYLWCVLRVALTNVCDQEATAYFVPAL
jgi:hypothetical protein